MILKRVHPQFYGRRQGRAIGGLKQELMETLLPALSFSLDQLVNVMNNAPICVMEIGFGGGEHLAQRAQQNPHILYIGVEVFRNGVAALLEKIHLHGLKNICIFNEDVRLLFPFLSHHSLDGIYVLFPDPWPKKKHLQRRLLNAQTLTFFSELLKPKGFLTIASDDPSYTGQIIESYQQCGRFEYAIPTFKRPQDWVITRYEEKALKAGRTPHYFLSQVIHDASF